MDIVSIDIKNVVGGKLKNDYENVHHTKSLPCLSVVQSVHGFYEIGLNGKAPSETEEGGAFIAPKGAIQNITHHNGSQGYMEAQWVFMKIIINEKFDFEDVFDMPLLIPSGCEKLSKLIYTIGNEPKMCLKYAAAYELADILISYASIKTVVLDNQAIRIKRYIDEHFNQKITKETLADVAFCSVPNLYRIFQKNWNLSPRNYINKIRLERASFLLENSKDSIIEISQAVGFDDPAYFSKLFKKSYRISPKEYRNVHEI